MTAFLAALLAIPLAAQVSDRARRVHDAAFVFDGHVHVVNRQFHHGGSIGDRQPDGDFDLPRAHAGGVDALFFSIFVTEDYYPERFETRQTFRLVDLALSELERNRGVIELARNGADVDRIHKSGRIAAVLDLEGGFDLDGDLGVLRSLYRLGMRSLQLCAHNWTNNFADSCCAPPKNNGLSEQGRAVVREMNRLGMVINISHASDAAIAQTIEISTDPVVATHHGLRSVNNIPRLLPDDLLRKLAAKGGVMGFQIGSGFNSRKAFEYQTTKAGKPFWDRSDVHAQAAPRSIFEIDRLVAPRSPLRRSGLPEELRITPDEFIAVVEKAMAVAGEDHISLGSDFDGGPTPPRGIEDISHLPVLTEAMLARGWTEARIRKFLGGNLLRVFRRITAKAP